MLNFLFIYNFASEYIRDKKDLILSIPHILKILVLLSFLEVSDTTLLIA